MRERRTAGEFVLDRRRTPRVPLRIDVACYVAGACVSGTTENLTVHGLFLETETPVAHDAEVEVVLELPGDAEPVKASGRVVRLAQRKDDTPGFAVEFESLDEPARARITALVDETLVDLTSPERLNAMERRRSPRAKCRFPCELVRLHERTAGTVLDVSEGGLSVHTQTGVDQGEPLLVRIQVPNQGELELETMVWHVRRARRRDSGDPCSILGLMVSKAPDAYFALVPGTTPDEGREPDRAPEAESSQLPNLGTDSTGLRPFHIRVKARSGPRTRVLSLSADSEDEARTLALASLDDEWELLEVRTA